MIRCMNYFVGLKNTLEEIRNKNSAYSYYRVQSTVLNKAFD